MRWGNKLEHNKQQSLGRLCAGGGGVDTEWSGALYGGFYYVWGPDNGEMEVLRRWHCMV